MSDYVTMIILWDLSTVPPSIVFVSLERGKHRKKSWHRASTKDFVKFHMKRFNTNLEQLFFRDNELSEKVTVDFMNTFLLHFL